jgi:hypothetical protein
MSMYMTSRCIAALGAVVLAVVALAACGGGDSGAIVAQVGSVGSISKATLDHWIHVEAVVLYQQRPPSAVPKGVVPDPPDYKACIAYLESIPQKLVERGPTPTALQLESKCRQRYQELREITLNTLILWDWSIAAGEALGMKASDAEARQQLVEERKRFSRKGEAGFANYLKWTGQTIADMLLRSRVEVFEGKLVAKQDALQKLLPKSLPAAQLQQSELAKFIAYQPPGKRWVAITSCRKGYIVSACKQYRGPQPPGSPN